MSAASIPDYVTPEEYLRLERQAKTKSEYYDGQVVAMAGAKLSHNQIAFNIARLLGNQLDGTPCQVVVADQKVRVVPCNRFYYPDIVVICGEPEFLDSEQDALLNPAILIEVLSESTERRDRGEKLRCYRQLSSLQAYIIATVSSPFTETYLRQSETDWQYIATEGMDASLQFEPIGCSIPLRDIYARTHPAQPKLQSP